ncbi:DsbA family protein [Citrobacter braakii]|uniref:DsbA family protein n=1 Tax=Citrobacter braakii TaxID=57706 RepID=UPI002B24B6BB|nr:DsbA family protein [Citrobacter braakii]MEB1007298.1 DsbA family protein [Citrobacter braakii]
MDKQRNEKCSSGNKTIFAWAGGIVVVIGMVWLMVISFISYKTQVMTNQLLDKISTSLAKNPAVQQGVNGNIQDEVKGALKSIADQKLAEERKALYKGWDKANKNTDGRYIYGEPGARFSLINYEDLECPFCKRFKETPKYIVDTATAGAVNWEWRHYPMSFHEPVASKGAAVAECIAEQKGPSAFWAVTDYWFNHTETNGKGFKDADSIPALFEVDQAKFDTCMGSTEVIKRSKQDMEAGSAAGVDGTPTTIVRDNVTGKEVSVVGAQPFSKFVEVIQSMVVDSQRDTSGEASPAQQDK